ncbi:MAG: replication restart DNA helicase PriA [Kovacikia sp.]
MNPTIKNPVSLNVFSKNLVMEVCCPNCGRCAERHYLVSEQLIRTQCSTCDYLMITCSETGKVIEAYAPGIYASH